MTDPLSERMERLETVATEAAEAARERDEVASEVGRRLADRVEAAVAEAGANAESVAASPRDDRFRVEARLDRAATVAALTDALPAGFVVSHVNDDGSLTVEWTGSDRTPTARERDAVLKAIVAEETVTDGDGFVASVPTRERVVERAVELGVPEDAATDRLERLAALDMVDLADGRVYPGENFSRI